MAACFFHSCRGKRGVLHRSGRRHGTMLCIKLYLADSFWKRAAGLLFYPNLDQGEGLWLKPCSAVHTMGMSRPIDVVFFSSMGHVLKTVHAMKPNRLAWCFGADSVVELPANFCRRHVHYQAALLRAMRAYDADEPRQKPEGQGEK